MNILFRKSWKTMLVNGLIAVIFGLLFLFVEQSFVKIVVMSIGAIFVLLAIILSVIDIYKSTRNETWGLFILQSVIYLIFGVLLIVYSAQISKFMYIIFGIWILISGVFQVINIVQFKKYFAKPFVSLLSAIFLVLMGLFLVFLPETSEKITTVIIGCFLLATGLWQVFNAFRFKKILSVENSKTEIVDVEATEVK